jgi:hypothetical protein
LTKLHRATESGSRKELLTPIDMLVDRTNSERLSMKRIISVPALLARHPHRRWAVGLTATALVLVLLIPALAVGKTYRLKHGKLENNPKAELTMKVRGSFRHKHWKGKVTHFIISDQLKMNCPWGSIDYVATRGAPYDFKTGGAESSTGWGNHPPKLDKDGEFKWKDGYAALGGHLKDKGKKAVGKLRIKGGADLGGCDTGFLHWGFGLK